MFCHAGSVVGSDDRPTVMAKVISGVVSELTKASALTVAMHTPLLTVAEHGRGSSYVLEVAWADVVHHINAPATRAITPMIWMARPR
jgi:hypothetical protein